MNHQQAMAMGSQQPVGAQSGYPAGGGGPPVGHQRSQSQHQQANAMYLQDQGGQLGSHAQQPMLSGQHSQQQQQQPQQQPYSSNQHNLQHHGGGPVGPSGTHHSSSSRSQMYPSGGSHHHRGSSLSQQQQSQHHHHGYSAHHRSAAGNMMHQHRSSAAAISDPMMAGGITEHLASAGGPLTGSGGALNQIGGGVGYSAGYAAGEPLLPASSYRHSQLPPPSSGWDAAGFDSSASAPPLEPTGHHHQSMMIGGSAGVHQHQSRYDAHYTPSATTAMPGSRRHQSSSLAAQHHGGATDGAYGAYSSHSQPPYGSGPAYGSQPLEYSTGRGHPPAPLPPIQASAYGNQPQLAAGSYGLGQAATAVGGLELAELRARLQELQVSYANVKRELEMATQKLGSSMHSIKSFWSPELKKERALRKEEQTKYALINDQMKMMRVEVQKQALLIRQLEDELRLAHETSRLRATDPDIQQHLDALCAEKENLFKENCLLRDTIRELEMRIETQKQTLAARDDHIRKMVEMMNNKGLASKMMEDERLEVDRVKTRNIELEARLRHYETIIVAKEKEIIKPQTSVDARPDCLSPLLPAPKGSTKLQVPKSPVPKQRKSLLTGSSQAITKQSKAERLKSRLASATSKTNLVLSSNKRHEEELLVKSSSSVSNSLSCSSSSGVSSSRSLENSNLISEPTKASKQLFDEATRSASQNEKPIQEDYERDYKLCQCHECQTSGQEIYSRDITAMAAPTAINTSAELQTTVAKKMVSFQPKVEHIGSPSYRLLKDSNQQRFLAFTGATANSTPGQRASNCSSEQLEDETCDSLHATKDFSLMLPASTSAVQGHQDYLRPLDCSTPIGGARQSSPSSAYKPSEQLVRAEVHHNHQHHHQEQRPGATYTCLCAPDFMCVHNYPHLIDQTKRPLSNGFHPQQLEAESTLVASSRSDFPLSESDCYECKNLSTYVNLSALSNGRPLMEQADQSSGEYKHELLNRQPQLSVRANKLQVTPAHDITLEEQMHYLSEARRLSQMLANCGLCSEQLRAHNGSLLRPPTTGETDECNCPLGANRLPPDGAPLSVDQSNSSRQSYHTASSSLPVSTNAASTPAQIQDERHSLMDANLVAPGQSLSVLPLAGQAQTSLTHGSRNSFEVACNSSSNNNSTQQQHEPQLARQAANLQSNQMDSSLSSLFVYRHPSDNDADAISGGATAGVLNDDYCDASGGPFVRALDPDSLELEPAETRKPAGQVSWLKPRPRSDYIPLSSLSTGKQQGSPSQQQQRARSFVDSDLSKSSIARRRQLNISQQNQRQQQQQQVAAVASGSAKKKLLASRLASRSSPNVSQNANSSGAGGPKANSKGSHGHSTSSSNSSGSNVKSIYQCVKSHLLDITSLSKSSSNSSGQHVVVGQKSGASSTLPARGKQQIGPNSAAQRNLQKSAAPTARRQPTLSKAVQMEELRGELTRRDQELLTMGAKMKALEEQQRDSQRHIMVLKDSLMAKEEHYNLLLADREELRRNLDERNRLIDRRSYQQTFAPGQQQPGSGGGGSLASSKQHQQFGSLHQEIGEMQGLLEMRDKRIGELQRKLIQLENLLAEREAHLERARMRLEHNVAGNNPTAGYQDVALLNHLEETLGDKEKQISLLRDQRDRAEHELNEERDSHERSIKEYKMKLNSIKFEMDKLQNRLNKGEGKFGDFGLSTTSDRFSSSGGQQQELVKRLELDKRALQLECERLKDKLELSAGGLGSSSAAAAAATSSSGAMRNRYGERASSALGDYSVVEFERLQEALEGQKQELRRAQAECRMNEMERKRAQEEADKLSERCERISSDMHKLKAKLENTTGERDQILEDYERQQQMLSKAQTERDCALADINQVKLDNERLRENFNKLQLDCERLQAQVERSQLECRKLDERRLEEADELRQLTTDKASLQRELSKLEMSMKTNELAQKRLVQEKELARGELERIRERHERLESEMERQLQEKELQIQQTSLYKERLEQQQQQLVKLAKERDQLAVELEGAQERLHKQQKLQDTSEHETRNEVRLWKEKYERLLLQYEKLNEDVLAKQKECQLVMEKLQRQQSDNVKLESRLEQSEMDKERLVIELEKSQQLSQRVKEEQKKWSDELHQLQEMYTKTSTKLLNLTEIEERLRIDYEKCQMDLEVLRERYERLQLECRKMQQERDRLQMDHERLRFDQETRGQQAQTGGQSGAQSATSSKAQKAASQQQQQQQQQQQEEATRLAHELERALARLDQYQREINKLQLEKERLILDSKAAIQQSEQQHQQQLLKVKAQEEKLLMELERGRLQLDKVQSKSEQTNVDQEKLVADKERLQQQLLLLQQEVDKFRSQQSNSVQETKRLHDEEMQRVLQELETIRDKYTQQRKELLQLRELQQNHELDKDILRRELEAAESRLEKLQQNEGKQRQDSERCLIEIEKLKDKFERKQQEMARTQKERDQFAQEIQLLHKQIQQLQIQYEQQQAQTQQGQKQQQQQQPPQQQQNPQVKLEEIQKLKQMLVKSENDLQKTMAENQRLQMEVERLKLQLDDAGEYIGRIENDNKMIARQNAELLEQMKIQADEANKQQAGASADNKQQQDPTSRQQKELELAQQEMKKMQEVIKKSSLEIQRIHEEKSKLAEANKLVQQALEQTKSEFNSTIEQYENELERLQKESQQRELQLQQQQSKPMQQQQQQQQAQASDEYKAKFEKAVEAIKAFQKTTEDMKREIFEMNKRNKTLSEQNQTLNETLRKTEENLQRASAAAQANSNSNQQANQQQQSDEMRQQVAKLSELCAKLEHELRSAQEESQHQLASNQKLKQAMDKTQAEYSSLKGERDRYQAQLEKLIVELEGREDEMANLQTQQDKSGQNLQAKQNELQNYQKQLEEREKALEAKRQELANLSKQMQQQQQPTANNQAQQEMIAKLQVQVKNLEEERAKLRGELERVRNELKQAQAELERLLKILSASEEEKFNLTQQIDQLQAKLKSMPPSQQQQQQQQQPAKPPQQQPSPQQQSRGPPPPPGQQQGPRAQAPGQQRPTQQQQQQRPPNPQQQQKGPPQQQRQSGAGAFISGFFQ